MFFQHSNGIGNWEFIFQYKRSGSKVTSSHTERVREYSNDKDYKGHPPQFPMSLPPPNDIANKLLIIVVFLTIVVLKSQMQEGFAASL